MTKIGSTDPTWSLAQAIQDQIEKESWREWAASPNPTIKYNYTKVPFHLTEAAKEAFTKGINYFKL